MTADDRVAAALSRAGNPSLNDLHLDHVPKWVWVVFEDRAVLAAEVERLLVRENNVRPGLDVRSWAYREGYLDGYEDRRLERDARFQR